MVCFGVKGVGLNPSHVSSRVGIVLAAGTGSRMFPVTKGVNKHLLPVYDKPMVYYAISVLRMAGVQEMILICTPESEAEFVRLFANNVKSEINLNIVVQEAPNGIADAFRLARSFCYGASTAVILGDNIFHGPSFEKTLVEVDQRNQDATVFALKVDDPKAYSVLGFNENGTPTSITEKPIEPLSNYAVTGLYFYDEAVWNYAESLVPSDRGELEIADINNRYLQEGRLKVEFLEDGFTWFDTGTFDSLLDASNTIRKLQNQSGMRIGSLNG